MSIKGFDKVHETVEEAIADFKAGKIIIMVDDEDRENEGDFVVAAEKVTPEAINFMVKYGRGLVCLAMTEEQMKKLGIPMMVENNRDPYGTAFGVSIDARHGITTGISAFDRATTILAAIRDDATPDDVAMPGHIFPLRARTGGAIVRAGHTEGSVDLVRLAGLKPAGVICEIMNDDGTMSRLHELVEVAKKFNLKIITIADIIAYRIKTERLVRRVAESKLHTRYGGEFKIIVFDNDVDSYHHVALVKGEIEPDEPVLVRVHSQCLTGDVFGSLACDCQDQLHTAMEMIASEKKGVLVYLHQEGRGIGLVNKIKAYALQEVGYDTVEANVMLGFQPDQRDYGIGAQILLEVGVRKMRLMTNNPKKRVGLEGFGLEIVEVVPLEVEPRPANIRYLKAKREKLGHNLTKVIEVADDEKKGGHDATGN